MKKFSKAALLKKKRWTGEDVGQAYIYNIAIQAPGKKAEPIDGELMRSSAAALDSEEFSIYREYMNVYNWLLCEFSLAQATVFHAKSAICQMLIMLLEAKEADEQRTRIMRAPVQFDGGELTTAIQTSIDKLLNPQGAPLAFTFSEMADIALLNASDHIMPREYFMNAHAFIAPTVPMPRIAPEVEEQAEKQARGVLELQQLITGLLKAHKGDYQLDEFDTGLLKAAICDKLKGKIPRVEAPLTVQRLEWYKDYKEAVSLLPGADSTEYSFATLYALDYEGFFAIARNAFNPLYDLPRYKERDPAISAPAGTPSIREAPMDIRSVNVKIKPDGTVIDLLADGKVVEDLTEKGIYKYSGKGKNDTGSLSAFTAQQLNLDKDIENTRKFNLLIDLIAERTGVEEIKRYKRNFDYIKPETFKYNFALQEYRERLEFTGENKTMKYTFSDLEKRTAALATVTKGMHQITLETDGDYPESTIERIRAAFQDLNIFGGASSKIYKLFDEGGDN